MVNLCKSSSLWATGAKARCKSSTQGIALRPPKTLDFSICSNLGAISQASNEAKQTNGVSKVRHWFWNLITRCNRLLGKVAVKAPNESQWLKMLGWNLEMQFKFAILCHGFRVCTWLKPFWSMIIHAIAHEILFAEIFENALKLPDTLSFTQGFFS